MKTVQRRAEGLEYAFRSASDGSPIFEGYAAVFNVDSQPITDWMGAGYIETLRPSSFTRSLTSGRRHTFDVDHDPKLHIASTSGGLRLTSDTRGLHVESRWPNTDYAQNVRGLYESGEPLSMSIVYRPTKGGDEWDVMRKRHTVSDAALKSVTVLTWQEPAFAQTTAAFRALASRTETNVEDIEDLMDALKDGRPLDEVQRNLLTRLAADPAAGEAAEAQPQSEEVPETQTVEYWRSKFAELPEL